MQNRKNRVKDLEQRVEQLEKELKIANDFLLDKVVVMRKPFYDLVSQLQDFKSGKIYIKDGQVISKKD